MSDKYIAELFLSIINELARNNLINEEAWKEDAVKLQTAIKHMEAVERTAKNDDTDTAMGEI